MIGVVHIGRLVIYRPIAEFAADGDNLAGAHVEEIGGVRYAAHYLGNVEFFREWPEALRAAVARDLEHQRGKGHHSDRPDR